MSQQHCRVAGQLRESLTWHMIRRHAWFSACGTSELHPACGEQSDEYWQEIHRASPKLVLCRLSVTVARVEESQQVSRHAM